MSDLLLNWLNDEIQLSKRITNFEDDFHNGFLFGELLAKYSQQLNFHEFVDKYINHHTETTRPLELKIFHFSLIPSRPCVSPTILMSPWKLSESNWVYQKRFSMNLKQ